ncbi:hypothetical protein AvCA_44870 [Azotobacter vinelandii CA]|uniref:Uncharacterized protein n=2 Tax=Azotobacter vinelandii TaxID=354 RepID=C1DGV8_AZOVD|nr:hypothetical protein Avin_44870 [Azotobacter vinelandii DJ]AGK14340.1 hypothetical protein AvCA_44870 [Azotobacter vinelandii CA]AGK22048.1 hypothetical protein AvCA6_44870 [Azotobacter vinelandii CA6]
MAARAAVDVASAGPIGAGWWVTARPTLRLVT